MAVSATDNDISAVSTHTRSVPGIRDSSSRVSLTHRRRRRWPFRSSGSSNTIIILAWMFIMCCSQELTDFYSRSRKQTSSISSARFILYYAMFSISCPIASLLAEVVVGRYKFISYTLRAQWLLSVVGSVITVGEYYLQTKYQQHVTRDWLLPSGNTCCCIRCSLNSCSNSTRFRPSGWHVKHQHNCIHCLVLVDHFYWIHHCRHPCTTADTTAHQLHEYSRK